MLEMLSLVFFALVVYTFLVIIPTVVERLCDEDFKQAYFAHLGSKHITTFGK